MKAFIFEKYGEPEKVLRLRDIEKPKPKNDEVLIQIHAAAVNDYDWAAITGRPLLYRLLYGLLRPRKKHRIPGMELAGSIDAIGPNVKNFKIGDEVFGDISDFGFGTFAEYISISEKAVQKKPDAVSFVQAAAMPHASLLAWQAFQKNAALKPQAKVLINGAGGGFGHYAMQLAQIHSCHVTGVDSEEKLETLKSNGFDALIDYRKKDFSKTAAAYDFILDCQSNKWPAAYLRSLKPRGVYVTVGGNIASLINILLWGKILSLFSSKKISILALKANKDIATITELFLQKKIQNKIDGPYAFAEIPKCIQYFGEAKHTGKIVIDYTLR